MLISKYELMCNKHEYYLGRVNFDLRKLEGKTGKCELVGTFFSPFSVM